MIKYVPKGWGYEEWIVNNDKYCGKKLFVLKDKKCSYHYHKEKHETFFIQKGKLVVAYTSIYGMNNSEQDLGLCSLYIDSAWINSPIDDEKGLSICKDFVNMSILCEGDSLVLEPYTAHCFFAKKDTTIFEFSTHHEDSDSYRIIKGD